MRLNKPVGIFLLLWPTLWALWIAGQGRPDSLVLTVFIAGVILMRSAGCIINDYADRFIDPHVARTKDRPLASGRVSVRAALSLFVLLCLCAFALVLLMNRLTILLSIGAVCLAIIYPFMKRYTHMPQAFLGLAFAWAIPMVFSAQTGTVPPVAWLLFVATVLWTVAYDTMYAMVDREDDRRIGVKSSALLFGRADRIVIAVLQFMVVLLLVLVGRYLSLGLFYYAGITGAVFLVVYQQYLIKDRDVGRCFQAFLNNNWFGAVIFCGLAVDYYLQ